jgi:hypothetical protein
MKNQEKNEYTPKNFKQVKLLHVSFLHHLILEVTKRKTLGRFAPYMLFTFATSLKQAWLNVILGSGTKHFAELGVGELWVYDFIRSVDLIMATRAGYRFQGDKGFLFRATVQYVPDIPDSWFTFWAGLSFGYSF